MRQSAVRSAIRSSLLAACILASACSDSAGPNPGTQSFNPNFLRAAADAPAVANPVLAFYAKKGVDSEEFMYYRPRGGVNDSTVFVRFRVDRDALLTRPDGSAIAAGDSVLITITLTDPARLILDMQPAGLRFSSNKPAELKISFLEADDDLNDDGRVDNADTALQSSLAIWRREQPGQPWMKLVSIVEVGLHEVEAVVTGFTGYAIAW